MSYDDGGARCQVDDRFRRLKTLTKGKLPFTKKEKAELQFTEKKNGGHQKRGGTL